MNDDDMLQYVSKCTVIENRRKSLIQHCEQSELRLRFECTKVNLKRPKNGEFLKT